MSETVIVTGCAGFIGSHLAEALLRRGDAVVGVDAFTAHYDPARKRANLTAVRRTAEALGAGDRFRFTEGDVRDRDVLDDLFALGAGGLPPARKVAHLAARAGVRGALDQAPDYVAANLVATTEVLEACRRHGLGDDGDHGGQGGDAGHEGQRGHLVLASSSTVYGSGPAGYDGPFSEDLAADEPLSVYGATKRGCELLAHAYSRLARLRVTCLRFFGVVGPRVRTDLAAYGFVDAVTHGRPITKFGDGTTARDYTYVGDIVRGILLALDRFERAAAGRVEPGGDFECVNLGNDRPVTLNAFLEALGRLLDREVVTVPAPEHPMDAKRTWADLTKARRLLGYEPTTSFEAALESVVEWYDREIRAPVAVGSG
ncbi:MAG TPA: GDP-mannose 4,6-dehydratase [Chloroflexota bacterium]|nr:GDP-mannose 4,6-dehydratase [Chloroflexota bacterium]